MVELPTVGAVIDEKYRLTSLLGEGGMGAVYAAEHVLLGKPVAIKFLHPHDVTEQEPVHRFYREAQAAASMNHKGIVEIFDVGWTAEGVPFLVMEYLHGESLEQVLEREERLTPNHAIEIAMQCLSALIAVHRKGIVHRDLKPANIFLCYQSDGTERVKLLDFGISKVSSGRLMSKITQTGVIFGTPHYMSPEAARGAKDTDHQVDVWAMGVILYEMLTGRIPYDGDSYNELLAKILTDIPLRPRELDPDIPMELEAIVLKAMAAEREERYRRTEALLADLIEFQDDGLSTTRPPSIERASSVPSPSSDETRDDSTPAFFDEIAEEPPSLYPRWSRRSLVIVALVALAGVLIFGTCVAVISKRSTPQPSQTIASSPSSESPVKALDAYIGDAPDFSKADTGYDATPSSFGNEIDAAPGAIDAEATQSPEKVSQSPSRSEKLRQEQAVRAISRVRRAFQDCIELAEPPPATIEIRVLAKSNGQLSYQSSTPVSSKAVEGCLEKTIGRLSLPTAAGPDIDVSVPVKRRRAGKSGVLPRGLTPETVEFL